MISKSALENVHFEGQFGDYEDKNKEELLNICELKNLLIVQIVQYKNSQVSFESINIDNLRLNDKPLNVASNDNTRILWVGPKNWLLVSSKKDLIKNISESFEEKDFAVTDLSHSRAVFEIKGKNVVSIGDTSFSTDTDLSKIKSKNIKLGIRSEFVELHDKHIDNCISVKIDKVDDFGNFQLVSAMHGENAIKAKVKRDFAVPAGEAWMKFPVDRCCVYSNEVLV